jgi:hypothetical protein
MIKFNYSFFRNLILMVFLVFLFFYFDSKVERIMEEITIIKSLIEDIDYDIHEIEETLTK